jgi:hypothetical protein
MSKGSTFPTFEHDSEPVPFKRSKIFCDVTPCRLMDVHWLFGKMCLFHPHDRRVSHAKKKAAISMWHTELFEPEDGRATLLQNVEGFIVFCTALQPDRSSSLESPLW